MLSRLPRVGERISWRDVSWEKRRSTKIWLLRVLVLMVCGLIALSAVEYAVPAIDWSDPKVVREKIGGKLGPFSFLLDLPIVRTYFDLHPRILVFGFGAVVLGGLISATAVTRFHDRFLATFNSDVLKPITRLDTEQGANSFVQLPWIVGTDGPRATAWNALLAWARPKAESGRPGKVSMALLVGRSGSGKSRMGFELARELARRDLLGGVQPSATPAWKLNTYARRVLPFLKPEPDDPWDAGLLSPNAGEDFTQFCARLRTWKPRRPTILILDDPVANACEKVWQELAPGNSSFRHPVKLLVLNQTVPADTAFRFDTVARAWKYENRPADPAPVSLSRDAWLTPQEAREALFHTGVARSLSPADKSFIRENLHLITEGNPLLVALFAEWVRDYPEKVQQADQAKLPEARVGRILESLQQRGVTDVSQLAALAVATLVGGADRDRLQETVSNAFLLAQPLPPPNVIRACFPSEPLDTSGSIAIPAVRPDLIADGFVDRVLQEIDMGYARAVAEAAFKIDPARMLRAIRRVRDQTSLIGQALLKVDPATIPGLDPVDLALAYADLAAICEPNERPLSTSESRAESLKAAIRALEQLDVAQATMFGIRFVDLCLVPAGIRTGRQVRPTEARLLLLTATKTEGTELPLRTWIRFFRALPLDGNGMPGPPDALVRLIPKLNWNELEELEAALLDHSKALFAAVAANLLRSLKAEMSPARQAMEACCLGAFAAFEKPTLAQEYGARALGLLGGSQDPVQVRLAASCLARAARAWAQQPSGVGASESRKAANQVEVLAARFPQDRELQWIVAHALTAEAIAWSRMPGSGGGPDCRMTAEKVAMLAIRFPDAIELQRASVRVRHAEAFAWSTASEGRAAAASRSAADAAAATAARFPDDIEIQRESAHARSLEAFAWSMVNEGRAAADCQSAAHAVAAIAAPFPDDIEIQRSSACALEYVATASAKVPAGKDAATSRKAAEEVAALAARFPDDQGLHYSATCARHHEARGWASVPKGARADCARLAAQIAAAIAERFQDSEMILRESCGARYYEAFAWCHVPLGAKALECRVAADQVAAQAACLPKDSMMQSAAAEAYRFEAFAWSQVAAGGRADESREAANKASALAMRFPDDLQVHVEAAEARSNEAYAWSQVPAGARAAETREAAIQTARLAEKAKLLADGSWESSCLRALLRAAEAHNDEAFAWSQVPEGRMAQECHTAAHKVAELAARFPQELQIQIAAANACSHETFAWSKVPGGIKAPECSMAAARASELATRSPDELAIVRDAAKSRLYELAAWSKLPDSVRAAWALNDILRLSSFFPTDAELGGIARAARRQMNDAENI